MFLLVRLFFLTFSCDEWVNGDILDLSFLEQITSLEIKESSTSNKLLKQSQQIMNRRIASNWHLSNEQFLFLLKLNFNLVSVKVGEFSSKSWKTKIITKPSQQSWARIMRPKNENYKNRKKKKRNGARARRHKNDKNDAAARNPISHPRVTSVFNLRLSLYYHREREREFQFWREIEIKKWIRQTGTILSITASMIKTHLLISLGPNKSTLFGYSFNLSLNFLCRWLNLISV